MYVPISTPAEVLPENAVLHTSEHPHLPESVVEMQKTFGSRRREGGGVSHKALLQVKGRLRAAGS